MEAMMTLARLAGTPGVFRPRPGGGRIALQSKLDLAGNPVARRWVVEDERRRRQREDPGGPRRR